MSRLHLFSCRGIFLLVPIALFARGGAEQGLKGFVGTLIPHPAAAADFALTDQHGTPFRMAGTKGRVVVLTFIYTHCTDTCPFVALKLREAINLLGEDSSGAAFVAVTTDPLRDTQPVIAAYSTALGLDARWHFLTGPAGAVQAVWAKYGIGVTSDPEAIAPAPSSEKKNLFDSDAPTQGLSRAALEAAAMVVRRFGGGYEVSHSVPFWFIDRGGLVRGTLDASGTPADIAADVKILFHAK